MKDDKKRRNAVARIMGAEDKGKQIAAEAKRAGVHPRTVERWVEAAGHAVPGAGQDAVPGNAAPQGNEPKNPVLEELLQDEGAAAGEGPKGGPPTAGEIQSAAADAERYCLEAYAGIRAATGAVLVSAQFSPPLDASSPEVLALLKVSKPAELAIRANAPRLYPILVKYASNWGALLLAIAADAMGMVLGLQGLAKSKGWTEKQPRERKADVPPTQAYSEQLRPTPPPPAPAPAAAAAEPSRQDLVVDAPLPTPEQLEAARDIRMVMTG